MIRFKVAQAALEDISDILSYYGAPSSAADAFSDGFTDQVQHLRQWPYTGHRRRDLTGTDVCFWQFDPYLIVFNIQDELLSVVAVLHSARNIRKILRKRLR